MNRLYELELRMMKVIDAQEGKMAERDETLEWEKIHMISSARCGYMLGLQRGMSETEAEIAACAACVHDFGRILSGKQANHAEAGYAPVREFLNETELFTEEEIDTISTAVKNHSLKTEVGTAIEEIVKDADVIDCFQYGLPFDRSEKEERYYKIY